MKNYLLAITATALLLAADISYAGQPTDINYCARGKNVLGVRYSVYTVRCSDGKKREITSWNKRKKMVCRHHPEMYQ